MIEVRDVLQRQAATSAVVLAFAAGIAVVVLDRPIRGAIVIGATLVGAGVLRAVLSDRHAGMLVNRGRTLDALVLTAIGLAMVVLAVSLHQTYRQL